MMLGRKIIDYTLEEPHQDTGSLDIIVQLGSRADGSGTPPRVRNRISSRNKYDEIKLVQGTRCTDCGTYCTQHGFRVPGDAVRVLCYDCGTIRVRMREYIFNRIPLFSSLSRLDYLSSEKRDDLMRAFSRELLEIYRKKWVLDGIFLRDTLNIITDLMLGLWLGENNLARGDLEPLRSCVGI